MPKNTPPSGSTPPSQRIDACQGALGVVVALAMPACQTVLAEASSNGAPLGQDRTVRGWMLLSDNVLDGLRGIERAPHCDINHFQMSCHVIHDLRHARDEHRLEIAQTLTEAAREAGIQQVALRDRMLYWLNDASSEECGEAGGGAGEEFQPSHLPAADQGGDKKQKKCGPHAIVPPRVRCSTGGGKAKKLY